MIATALARGAIDAETALIYRTFATFRDSRLPTHLRGDDTAGSDDEVMTEIGARFTTLSPKAQTILRPFLLPPYHAGSWWDLRRSSAAPSATLETAHACDNLGKADTPLYTDWQFVDTDGGHYRIWWQTSHPEDAEKARKIAAVVETIHSHLFALMKREPPGDDGRLTPCRGGDNRLDISLVDMVNNGEVSRFDNTKQQTVSEPSFMLLNRNRARLDHMRATLIHEMMHMFQFTFVMKSVREYLWWMEATATWSINYVEQLEPSWLTNVEHLYAPGLLDHPEFSLELHSKGIHQYGAYLLPFFVQLKAGGQSDLVRRSFERSETIANSLENLNGALDGGFRKQWPEFTLYNVNSSPVDDYQRADALFYQAKPLARRAPTLDGAPDKSYTLDGNVGHLSSHVYSFDVNDTAIRSMLFVNPFTSGAWPTASVRALVKIQDQWRVEDWTERSSVPFCRDLKAERVTKLVLVISNSEWRDRSHVLKPAYPPRLNVTNVACRGWAFEASAHYVNTASGGAVDETMHSSGVFVRARTPDDDGSGRSIELYELQSGKVTWQHTGHSMFCSGSGTGSFLTSGGPYALFATRPYATDDIATDYRANQRMYDAAAGEHPDVYMKQVVIYTCAGGSPSEVQVTTTNRWLATKPNAQINPDGMTFSGSWSVPEEGDASGATTYTWRMTALPWE